LEARAGIEPAHKGFADLSLTTWVPRLGLVAMHYGSVQSALSSGARDGRDGAEWSGRRDLNSRPSPWQGDALPLSYSRLSSLPSRSAASRAAPFARELCRPAAANLCLTQTGYRFNADSSIPGCQNRVKPRERLRRRPFARLQRGRRAWSECVRRWPPPQGCG
jgi:hypothetical protein